MSASSPPEDLHAALERTEANVARLEEENARIEQLLSKPRLASLWVLLPIGVMLVAATIGHLIGGAVAHREGAAQAAAQDRMAWLAHERSITADCRASYVPMRDALVGYAKARAALPDPPLGADRPCRCQQGDPLCSCL